MREVITRCILCNICRIEDGKGNILVQERTKKDWPGLNFPRGHVDNKEPLDDSVRREIKEETGLCLGKVTFCGIREWPWRDDIRYFTFVYKSKDFQGELKNSEEGKVFWIKKEDLFHHQCSQDLDKICAICESRSYRDESEVRGNAY